MEDDRSGPCIGTALIGTHGTGFIQQQSDGDPRNLVGKLILIEHLTIVPAQAVGIQTPSHYKTGLLAAALLILQLLHQALAELSGNLQQRSADTVILIFDVIVDFCDSVDLHLDAAMNITVGNTLGSFIEFLEAVCLKLFAGCLFSHLIQHTLNIRCRPFCHFGLIFLIIFDVAAHRIGNRISLVERDPFAFLIRCFLLSGAAGRAFAYRLTVFIGRIRCRASLRLVFSRFIFVFRLSCLPGFFRFISDGIGLAGQLLRAAACSRIYRNRLSLFGTRHRFAGTGRFATGTSDHLEHSGKDLIGRACTSGRSGLVLVLLAQFDIVFNVTPAADHDQADDLPSLPCGGGRNRFVNLRDQAENRLDPFIAQGRTVILDLTEECIGKHDLQDRLEDMAVAVIFLFDQLRYSAHFLILLLQGRR